MVPMLFLIYSQMRIHSFTNEPKTHEAFKSSFPCFHVTSSCDSACFQYTFWFRAGYKPENANTRGGEIVSQCRHPCRRVCCVNHLFSQKIIPLQRESLREKQCRERVNSNSRMRALLMRQLIKSGAVLHSPSRLLVIISSSHAPHSTSCATGDSFSLMTTPDVLQRHCEIGRRIFHYKQVSAKLHIPTPRVELGSRLYHICITILKCAISVIQL